MEHFDNFMYIIDSTLETSRKKHLIGGILMSVSLLFSGLAITVMTVKKEDILNE